MLQRIFDAARERECPIVHISALEGEKPFVASTPCLGDRPVPLVEMSNDQYLALMAEIWGVLTIEFDRELPMPIHVRGRRGSAGASERTPLTPRTIAGFLGGPFSAAGVQYTLDSYGQETTILYLGLRAMRDIQAYWLQRSEVYRAFVTRYACNDRDTAALLQRLDHTVTPLAIDLEAFAAARGLHETVCIAACR
jgi:hypothetical protein